MEHMEQYQKLNVTYVRLQHVPSGGRIVGFVVHGHGNIHLVQRI